MRSGPSFALKPSSICSTLARNEKDTLIPFYTKNEGVNLYKDDACDQCDYLPCQVHVDLALEMTGSRWHETHIRDAKKITEAERARGCIGCQGFKAYIAPREKADVDPEFGRRISAAQANLRDGMPEHTERRDLR
jgi:hypothetical protein